MSKLRTWLKRWWHNWVVADAEESKSLDEREQRAIARMRQDRNHKP